MESGLKIKNQPGELFNGGAASQNASGAAELRGVGLIPILNTDPDQFLIRIGILVKKPSTVKKWAS
jgi:hypothetical protein